MNRTAKPFLFSFVIGAIIFAACFQAQKITKHGLKNTDMPVRVTNANQRQQPFRKLTVGSIAHQVLARGVIPQTDRRFSGSIILDSREEVLTPNRIRRVQLLQTTKKYPFILSESVFEKNPATGPDKLVYRRDMVGDHVVVKLVPGKTEKTLADVIATIGGSILRKLNLDYSDTFLVSLPKPTLDAVPDAVRALAQRHDVFTFAEPDFISHKTSTPNDSQFNAQWNFQNTGQTGGIADADVDGPEAWSLQTGNDTIVIAISDTGVDYNHSDLSPNMWSNPDEAANSGDDDANGYVDDVRGWNFAYGNNNPLDDEGHGTFVAGVIGARGNNSIGIAGTCWQCKLMPLKALDNEGSGYNTDIAEGFNYARKKGAKILNASHAGPTSATLQLAVNNLEAAGVLLLAAADNDARNEDVYVDYPACYTNRNVISVGASDNEDRIAYFSNFGAKTVDLFAPGDSIWSTQRGNGYGLDSGTSFATPLVAGVAGLLKAQHPSWTVDQIKGALLNSVDIKTNLIGKCVSGGRLNAVRALTGNYGGDPGSLDIQFSPKWTVNGAVFALAVQTNGKLLIGGTFTNSALHRIARLNSDGSTDTFFMEGSGANGAVRAIALQPDGKIVIGGAFTKYNGAIRKGIARLKPDGTVDPSFNPTASANATVTSLLLQPDGKIVIGGAFNSVNGQTHEKIARLNFDGTIDATYNPSTAGDVECLALQSDGKILFGGAEIGRLNTDGTSDNSFTSVPGANGTIRTMAIDSSNAILIGGDFTTFNGTLRSHIARITSTGDLDLTFNPGTGANGIGASVSAIAISDDCTILASGNFSDFNDEQSNSSARPGIVRLSSSGSVDQTFDAGGGNYPGANAIEVLNDGRAYIGGGFTSYNYFPRRYVARIIARDSSLGTNTCSLSQTNFVLSPAPTNTALSVAAFGCAKWKTYVTNDWISITSGAVGIGSGTVVFSVEANTNRTPRVATLTIAGKSVTVTQEASLAPSTFFGRTITLNDLILITSPITNSYISHILTNETSGTFGYSISGPTNSSLTITDELCSAKIVFSFSTATTGTYTNSRGSYGTFTLYATRADFDGDNRADLLWVNSSNQLREWSMDGTNFLGANSVAAGKSQALNWKVVAVNDFNLDSHPDILWQNSLGYLSIWMLGGTNFEKSVSFGTSGSWKAIGMADLNYDGKKDLVFANGSNYLQGWFLDGTNRLGKVKLNRGKPAPAFLKPIGFDDFNADGQPDLLWQSTSNVLSVWFMNGTNFVGTNTLNNGQAISSDWKPVALNDFNYDGHADVLFENSAGELWLWLLNQTNTIESAWLQPGQSVDPKWRIASPR